MSTTIIGDDNSSITTTNNEPQKYMKYDEHISIPLRYSPANPQNPMIFNRVPYEKRLHWLWLWNPDNNPRHIDCKVAVETLTYFTSHQTQHQQRYYYGTYHGIADAKKDLEICMAARALAETDVEQARTMLENRVKEKEYEPEHVWKFREIPLKLETP
eukprot:UN03439